MSTPYIIVKIVAVPRMCGKSLINLLRKKKLLSSSLQQKHDNYNKQTIYTKSDTGGEVEAPISGRLLHDPFERRGAGLFRRFSSQPAHQLNES